MRSQRRGRLVSSVLGAVIVLVPAASVVRAQPGFGPDPFWPYNSQYAPYVSPIGPASPEAGQGGAMNARDGLRSANQFQDYLDSLSGPGRNISDRSNIGMPYYRSAVDPTYQTPGRGPRQYQPNAVSENRLEGAQRRAADLYFQFYSERDPARRGELLREYREVRRETEALLSGRGRSSSPRPTAAAGRLGSGASREGRARSTARTGTADRIGPAPEVPAIGSGRSATSSRSRRSLPSEVLDRSRAMDRRDGIMPGPGSSGLRRPGPGSSARSRARGAAQPSQSTRPTDDDRSRRTPGGASAPEAGDSDAPGNQ